jgi:hypothetical protein
MLEAFIMTTNNDSLSQTDRLPDLTPGKILKNSPLLQEVGDPVSEIDEILDRFWYQAIWSNDDDSIDFMAEKTLAKAGLSKMLVEARKKGISEGRLKLSHELRLQNMALNRKRWDSRMLALKKEKSNDE